MLMMPLTKAQQKLVTNLAMLKLLKQGWLNYKLPLIILEMKL